METTVAQLLYIRYGYGAFYFYLQGALDKMLKMCIMVGSGKSGDLLK
jgi:hypothetical protein